MSWVNLGVLGIGGLLMTAPILLHLLMQPKPKEIDFPALRFLKQRQQSTRSRMRLKHWLLLLMRCLVIGLLALALAGPSVASSQFGNWLSLGGIGLSALLIAGVALLAWVRPHRNWPLIGVLVGLLLGHMVYGGYAAVQLLLSEDARLIGDDQAPVAALIVIDTSPRMQLQFQNQTRLERAQDMANWLVSQFPVDSQVCIAATDGEPPFFSVDVGAAERRIEVLEIDFTSSGLPSTVEAGLKILEEVPQERKEIYLISDLTAASWSGENSGALSRRLAADEGIGLFVIDVGVPEPTNFSLAPLQLSAVEIAPEGRLTIDTRIQRNGPAEPCSVICELEKIDRSRPVVRDGRAQFPEETWPPQRLTRDVRSDGSEDVRFTISQTLPVGTWHGTVAIEGSDGMSLDDRRYFTFRVAPPRKVLVVRGPDVFERPLISLLAPESRVREGTARYECEVVSQSDLALDQRDLTRFDGIFLLDPQPLSDLQWQQLEGYVDRGGGLGIFLGHHANTNGTIDPGFQTAAAQRVLGGQLDLIWFDETDQRFLSPKEYSHPIFRPIQGLETNVLWNRFPINKHWGMQPETDNPEFPTQTLIRYNNREPAVIEREIGLGRVITMTTPVTEPGFVEGRRPWNRLLTGKPVPWFYLMTGISRYLVNTDAESLNVQVGETAVFENDLRANPESYRVFSPDPEKPPTPLNTVDGRIRFRFNQQPGQYRIRGVLEDEVVLRGFSSNLAPEATDLNRLQPADLDQRLGAGRYQLATEPDQIQRQQGASRRGQEFYPLVVVLMLVLLGVELLMSNRFYS